MASNSSSPSLPIFIHKPFTCFMENKIEIGDMGDIPDIGEIVEIGEIRETGDIGEIGEIGEIDEVEEIGEIGEMVTPLATDSVFVTGTGKKLEFNELFTSELQPKSSTYKLPPQKLIFIKLYGEDRPFESLWACLPSISLAYKWSVISICEKFEYLWLSRNSRRIKYTEILEKIRIAHLERATVVLQERFYDYPHTSFGLYCTHNSNKYIFIGPYSIFECDDDVEVLRIEGHNSSNENLNNELNKPKWFLQVTYEKTNTSDLQKELIQGLMYCNPHFKMIETDCLKSKAPTAATSSTNDSVYEGINESQINRDGGTAPSDNASAVINLAGADTCRRNSMSLFMKYFESNRTPAVALNPVAIPRKRKHPDRNVTP